MIFRRVLCPVDLSATSAEAVRLARGVVGSHPESELVLLHVTPAVVAVGDGLAIAAAEVESGLERHRLEEAFPAEPGTRTRHEVRRGSPASAICRFAADEHCDLVVMLTHGRTGLTRIIMGSVAEEVLRHAPCPVLLLRPGTAVPAPHTATAAARSSRATRLRP
jgi:nucleotide-binding universal stress UspA family protein